LVFFFSQSKQKWVLGEKSRAHTHDVKSLCIQGDLLVSGGIDTNLIAYSLRKFPKVLRETPSYPQKPLITLSKSKKILCCQFPHKLELWKLGKSKRGAVGEKGQGEL